VLLVLALAPVVFLPRSGDAFEPPRLFLLGTAMAALIAIALARGLARRPDRSGVAGRAPAGTRVMSWIRQDPLAAAVVCFLASSAVSTALSIRPSLSLLGVSSQPAGLVTALATASVFFAARAVGGTFQSFRRIASAASLAAAAAIGYALVQWAGMDPLPWFWTATLGDIVRVPGTLGHPNHLGTYLAMALPLVVLLARSARTRAAQRAWLLLAATAVFVLGITLSRGAWLAFLAGAAAYGMLSTVPGRGASVPARTPADPAAPESPARSSGRGARRAAAWAAVAALLFLLPLATPMGASFLQRLRQIADLRAPTSQTRLLLWRSGVRMLADHPLTGVGTDAFAAVYPRYRTPEFMRLEWASTSVKAHNELIQIGATQGVPGLLAALLVASLALRAVWRAASSRDSSVRLAAASAGAAVAAWAVSSLSGFTVIATGALAAALAGWTAGQARSAAVAAASPLRIGGGTPTSRAIATALALAYWIPLVLIPWLASEAASRGIGSNLASRERAEALHRASTIAPWDERYALELGRTLLAQAYAAPGPAQAGELFQRAGTELERAARIAPENVDGRALLAVAHAAQASLHADRARARQVDLELRAVLAADSTSPGTLDLVTGAYMDLGLYAPAHAVAIRCAGLYPGHAQPMADIGRIVLAEGRYSDAADTLALALQRGWHGNSAAESKSRVTYATALLRLGRSREARDEAGRALRIDPSLRAAARVRDEAGRALESGAK
jgi:O-antigen ligase/tetratricopeptide (TPR) repeat protein